MVLFPSLFCRCRSASKEEKGDDIDLTTPRLLLRSSTESTYSSYSSCISTISNSNSNSEYGGAAKAVPRSSFDETMYKSEVIVIFEKMNDKEQEIAARSSYQYLYKLKCEEDVVDRQDELSLLRKKSICDMIERYLVANGGIVDETLLHLRSTLEFREKKKFDTLRLCFNNTVLDPLFYDEETKFLQSILQEELGSEYAQVKNVDGDVVVNINARNKTNFEKTQNYFLMLYYALERAFAVLEKTEQMKELNNQQNTTTNITYKHKHKIKAAIHLRGCSLKNVPHVNIVKEFLHVLKTHFPERVEQIIVFDAPYLISMLWKGLKPLIDPNTANKVKFVDSSSAPEFCGKENQKIISPFSLIPFEYAYA